MKEFIKKPSIKKIIYPSVLIIFVVGFVVLFIFVVRFLSSAINQAFTMDTKTIEGRIIRIDPSGFSRIRKKLGILPTAEDVPVVRENVLVTSTIVSSTKLATTTTANVLDKSLIKIKVLNGTGLKGVASGLKDALVADGFTQVTTGNYSGLQKIITFKIKDSKKEYSDLIKKIILSKYEIGESGVLPEDDKNDVIIIVGK